MLKQCRKCQFERNGLNHIQTRMKPKTFPKYYVDTSYLVAMETLKLLPFKKRKETRSNAEEINV